MDARGVDDGRGHAREGRVESWVEVTECRGELVTFRSTLVFADATITSESTLRFRGRDEVAADLVAAGFVVEDVRDAPDRPGRELVFVASRPDESLAAHKERGWRELGVVDEALLRGEIDEEGWHRRTLDDRRAGVPRGRDAAGSVRAQRRRRALGAGPAAAARRGAGRPARRRARHRLRQRPADGVAGRVGCREGLVVEPYGVEISAGLADLARQRLPHWADRIWTGNAMTWEPPRRFDVVRTGLDYVPPRRRREFVERCSASSCARRPPGRRGLQRGEGPRDRRRHAALVGHRPSGATSRAHRDPRLRYKAVWVEG